MYTPTLHRSERVTAHPSAAAFTAVGIAGLFALAAFLLWLTEPPATVMRVIVEGGPVEGCTEILYFIVAAAMWLFRRPGDATKLWTSLCVMLCAFGAREMDLHKYWTEKSVLKISFYTGPYPLRAKLIALAVLIPILMALGYLVLRHARAAWASMKRLQPVGITIAVFVVTLVVSKVLDRSINVLAEDFQIYSSFSIKALVSSFEEILELALPVLAGVAFIQHRFSD